MSPRHGPLPPKSFAQHLLEIEREAARAARRVRGANARASLSFADPPLSAAGGARQAAGGQSTVADARLAEAEEVRCRSACDALVLRRALPEVESQLNSCAALLHASVRREEHASRRAGQLSQALSASQAAETRLAAEVQQLQLANVALTHRVAELERNAPVSGGPAAGASRLLAPPAGLVARGAGRGAAPQSGWAAQHAARPASAAGPVCAPPGRAAAVVSTPHTREKTACGARPVAERGGVIPEQAEIVQAAVALATLEAALVPGAQPYEAGLAAAAAAGAQMAATPPSDNDRRAAWVGYAQAVHWSPASSAEVTEALAAAPAWVAAVLAAADSFVGGSMAQLDGHVRGVLRDGTAAAVRELQARAAADGGAGVGRAAAAEAAARVMAALRASVGALQQQLADGLVRSLGTEPAAAACPVQLLGKLCARAVAASCEPLTRLTSHADLSAHILEEVGVYGAVAAALSRAGGPEEWLRDFILGREAAPMAEETSGFIATQARCTSLGARGAPRLFPRHLCILSPSTHQHHHSLCSGGATFGSLP